MAIFLVSVPVMETEKRWSFEQSFNLFTSFSLHQINSSLYQNADKVKDNFKRKATRLFTPPFVRVSIPLTNQQLSALDS